MDFSLTHLIVVPVGNTIPTTGSTQDLVAGKTGVFLNTYAVATAGNIAAAPYIYIAQGRTDRSLPSLRSDKINVDEITEWQKIVGNGQASSQITEVSAFVAKCEEQVALTVRLDSSYIRAAFHNGLTRSVVITTPCCDCDGDPCAEIANETIVDLFMTQLAADFSVGREAVNLTNYLVFEKIGTGDDALIRISAKALTSYVNTTDNAANPYMFDRLSFKTFVGVGPDSMSDFETFDRCEDVATVTVKQRASYPKLTSAEVKQLEKDYYSYKVSSMKELYRNPGWNGQFESFVTDGTVYNQYLIQFNQYDQNDAYNEASKQDSRVILLVPNSISDLETLLEVYGGAFTDVSGNAVTTTTTTSTTTTSTTTTTTLIP